MMNPLQSEICRILDFDENYLDVALKEAINRAKLQDTYMFVNGELRFINVIIPNENAVLCSSYDTSAQKVEIETLEAWNPETGIYSSDECSIVLIKKPLKQWKKSFHPNNYKYLPLKYAPGPDVELFIKVAKSKPEMFTIQKNKFFMYDSMLSLVKEGEIESPIPYYCRVEATKFLQEKGIKCPNLL